MVAKVVDKQRYNLLVADGHALVNDAIAAFLSENVEFSVVSACDLTSTLEALSTNPKIDLLLLEVSLPGMAGLESIKKIVTEYPGLKIVLLSGSVSSQFVFQSLQLGVQGYVPKSLPLRSLTSALRLVLSGQVFLPFSLLPEVGSDTFQKNSGASSGSLTDREINILRLASKGKTNKEIAWALGTSEISVKMYIRTIFAKLGASNRTHAVMLAKEKLLFE